jgi:hypothetical protein
MKIRSATFTEEESGVVRHVLHTSNIMIVEFANGNVYCSTEVPVGHYEDLVAAESKGSYFNRELRNKLTWVRTLTASKH